MSQAQPFTPSPQLAEQLATNRSGKFTGGQRALLTIAALVTGGGLLFMLLLLTAFLGATFSGARAGGVMGVLFILLFLLTFFYLSATLYVNASGFVPDALSRQPVAQSRGKLQLKMASRERELLPFSYIVGDYSFAPFMVSSEVPMQQGREYIVYYAKHSRVFLGVEPADAR